ncbi:hypothetical protein CWS02_15420 [Enterobacter sp. EA-1]|nr:hypothetical protein CWS02_15420 [Enterobacter sp. EA-1]
MEEENRLTIAIIAVLFYDFLVIVIEDDFAFEIKKSPTLCRHLHTNTRNKTVTNHQIMNLTDYLTSIF